MSVLINMEMPKCCWNCNFCKYLKEECGNFTDTNGLIYHCKDYFYCDLIEYSQFLDSEALHGKHLACPLIEVPPHGRLIDADALLESIKEARKKDLEIEDVYIDDYFMVAEWVVSAKTIIEAEGE